MKTTLDLPDRLMRRVRSEARARHQKISDVLTDAVRQGIDAGGTQRTSLPPPFRLRGGFRPATDEIEAAINWGRE